MPIIHLLTMYRVFGIEAVRLTLDPLGYTAYPLTSNRFRIVKH